MLSRLIAIAILVFALVGCRAGATTVPNLATPTAEPAATNVSAPVIDGCRVAFTRAGGAFQRMANGLASLRPVILDSRFDAWEALQAIRRISALVAFDSSLQTETLDCDQTTELTSAFEELRRRASLAVARALSLPINDAHGLRDAAVDLFSLLPDFLALSKLAEHAAVDRGYQVAFADVGADAAAPLGSLPPLETKPSPRPTSGSAGGGSTTGGGSTAGGWTVTAYNTAVAWRDQVWSTYSTTPTLWSLAYDGGCGPGQTPEECNAAREDGEAQMAPIKSALTKHLAWMDKHPAATCFRDAYAADRRIAKAYLDWIANWGPYGGEGTGQGRAQIYALADADALADAFFSKTSAYFSDCG